MLACCLDSSKYTISIYEKNSALGRKFWFKEMVGLT